MAKNIARNNNSSPTFLCNAASAAKFKGFKAWKFHNWMRPRGMIPEVQHRLRKTRQFHTNSVYFLNIDFKIIVLLFISLFKPAVYKTFLNQNCVYISSFLATISHLVIVNR
jgi:hypothetical protein